MLFFAESLAGIFKAAGFEDVRHYRYWDAESSGVCVDDMLHDLENAPDHSVVVLFASGHSPTGADISQEEWKRVGEVMTVRSRNFFNQTYFSRTSQHDDYKQQRDFQAPFNVS